MTLLNTRIQTVKSRQYLNVTSVTTNVLQQVKKTKKTLFEKKPKKYYNLIRFIVLNVKY